LILNVSQRHRMGLFTFSANGTGSTSTFPANRGKPAEPPVSRRAVVNLNYDWRFLRQDASSAESRPFGDTKHCRGAICDRAGGKVPRHLSFSRITKASSTESE
jgi:hypothetical protein